MEFKYISFFGYSITTDIILVQAGYVFCFDIHKIYYKIAYSSIASTAGVVISDPACVYIGTFDS